ncbi:MAG: hypothetical protein E7200_01110 [Selenomonas ruminantium]|jgi:hypothetical protein|nr:hypothetical protein [Selenomonas ruminantium]
MMLYATFILKENIYLNVFVMKEYEDRDGGDNLIIRVEQKEKEENFSEWRLPDMACYKSYGFSELDLFAIEDYLTVNESIIWDDWREQKNARIA